MIPSVFPSVWALGKYSSMTVGLEYIVSGLDLSYIKMDFGRNKFCMASDTERTIFKVISSLLMTCVEFD